MLELISLTPKKFLFKTLNADKTGAIKQYIFEK
jgi:hypothetical protein